MLIIKNILGILIMSYDKKKFNKISDRIKSIDNMLTEKDIEPMFNFKKKISG